MEIKKIPIKKILKITGIVLIIASIGLNTYFGLTKVRNLIYQKGIKQGQKNVLDQIENELKTQGQIRLKVGNDKMIILRPVKLTE